MPSSCTHNYFSIDVFNNLDKRERKVIDPCYNEYRMFAQGPDPYFFYNFHLLSKSKEIFKINSAMQHSHINDHFTSLINHINDKKYYSDSMVMAYLYGQICHYSLDTMCHPYIIYYAGSYNSKKKSTYKYNGLHEEMEYFIDCYLINKREGISPKKYKTYKELFSDIKFNDALIDTINTVTNKVYGFSDVSSIYYKSLKDMKKFYHVFNYDRFGIKKAIYSIIDTICGNRLIRKKELSFHIDPDSKIYYLNIEKKIWYHPCTRRESYDYSFKELYDMAAVKATNIIREINKMLKSGIINNKKIELLFNDLDYGTGKDWHLNLDYNFFRF